jgi:hypothetical protein
MAQRHSKMKPLLALPSIALLGLGVNACGGKGAGSAPQFSSSFAVTGNATTSTVRPKGSYLRGDDDADETNHKDEDDYSTRNYGHAASAGDKRTIVALVKRYYAVAAADDGARACVLIYSSLAKGSNLGEAAEVAYPPAPGVPPLRGRSCAQIMSLLFKEDHQQLAADVATIEVTSVRVKGRYGLALLGFRTSPERQIPVRRERGVWKIDTLLDEELP